MSDLTKFDAYDEAEKEISDLKQNKERNFKSILEHFGVVISLSVIVLSMILFAYNKGFCSVYNLPISVLSIDISRFLPIAVQLLGVAFYIAIYISYIITDQLERKFHFSITRVLIGASICSYIIIHNRSFLAYGIWMILLALVIPLLLELFLLLLSKIINKPIKNEYIDQDRFKHEKREYIISSVISRNTKIVICIMALALSLSSLAGIILANIKREYQVFENDNQSYAVIVDYSDKVLAQRCSFTDDSLLTIDTNQYLVISKEQKEYAYVFFKNVSLNKQEAKKALVNIKQDSVSTIDET